MEDVRIEIQRQKMSTLYKHPVAGVPVHGAEDEAGNEHIRQERHYCGTRTSHALSPRNMVVKIPATTTTTLRGSL